MAISRDPDKAAIPTTEEVTFAVEMGLKPVAVICDEPGSTAGNVTAISFTVFVDFVPRLGEIIVTQDGKHCRVAKVLHKVTKNPNCPILGLMPNVYAVRIERGEEEGGE